MHSTSSSVRQEHPSRTKAVTATEHLALVQYKPFQHAEIRLLQALSEALPWSEAVASALREALALAGVSRRPPASAAIRASGGRIKGETAQRKVKDESQRRRPEEDFSGNGSNDRGASGRRYGGVAAGGGTDPASAVHAIQLAMAHLGVISGRLSGAAEGRCSAAAFALSVAMASAAEGRLPPQLLRVVSPHRASLEQLRPLGKGGFGSVVAVRSRLDHRVMALKTVAFRSDLPPWSPLEQLERQHAKLLREVQALAGLEGSPHVVRYYNAWIEPAWEKLGQQLKRSTGREVRRAQSALQALSVVKRRAVQPTAKGPQPPSVARGAAPQAVNPGLTRRSGGGTTSFITHLSKHVLPRLKQVDSRGRSASGSQPCRIKVLKGSRSNSSDSLIYNSEQGDSASNMNSDSNKGSGKRSYGGADVHGGSQHHLTRAITPQRPSSPGEPLMDLLLSPDASSTPLPAWAAAAAEKEKAAAHAMATSRQPIVTLPPSSSEPSRRRSLDSTYGTLVISRRSTCSSGDDGTALGGLPGPSMLVSIPNTPEDDSPLNNGWPLLHTVGWRGRSHTLPPWSGQVLITSLSSSEGLVGATPTRGSFLSSSVESIRVPPGGMIARSPVAVEVNSPISGRDGGGGSGTDGNASASSSGRYSDICTLEKTVSSSTEIESVHIYGPRSEKGRVRKGVNVQEHGWTFDPKYEPERGARQDDTKSSTTDTTYSSSASDTVSTTATGTVAFRDGVAADTHGTEEFSWTFDRGNDAPKNIPAEPIAGSGAASTAVWTAEKGGDGGAPSFGGKGLQTDPLPGRYERYGDDDSDRDKAVNSGMGGRSGGVLERRSRKGRRGKVRIRGGCAGHCGGDCKEGRRLTGSSSGQSGSYSSSVSDSRRGDSITGSISESGTESRSGTGSLSESEGDDDSGGSESWNNYGTPDRYTHVRNHNQGKQFGNKRNCGRKDCCGGIIISPSQVPLPAPRHYRRLSLQQPMICSPTEDLAGDKRPRGLQELRQHGRRRQHHFRALKQATDTGGTNCTSPGGACGGSPAAASWDLAVLSSIRRWPYKLYISMELVRGPTLTLWLQQRAERLLKPSGGGTSRAPEHPPDPRIVERSIFRQIVAGLCYVHASGIIHRDLKPANIFLVPFETAPVAAHASTWTGASAESAAATESVGFGHAAAATRDPHTGERYLVKIGDFGLAVEHEELPDLAVSSSEASTFSTASSVTSAPSLIGSFGSATAVAAAADRRGRPLHRPASIPLLSNVPAASSRNNTGAWLSGGNKKAQFLPAVAAAGAANVGIAIPRWNSTSTSAHTSGVGTASYSAPEQLRDQSGGVSYYGPEVDIYPLGLILMELFCVHGTAMERANAMREARQGRLPASFLRTFPLEARLAEACLRTAPEKRPSAARILELLDIMWTSQMRPRNATDLRGSGGVRAATEGGAFGVAGDGKRFGQWGGLRGGLLGTVPGKVHGLFMSPSKDSGPKQGPARDWGIGHDDPRRTSAGLQGETKGASVVALRATASAMQRAASGPLLPYSHPLLPEPLPLLPPLPSPQPFHSSFAKGPLASGEGCIASIVDPNHWQTAVAAMLEDVGTQTELTWVPEHQQMPRPLGRSENAPVRPMVLADASLREYTTAASEYTAVKTVACAIRPDVNDVAKRSAESSGTETGVSEKAGLIRRLHVLEAEVQQLREQLANAPLYYGRQREVPPMSA